MVDRIRIAKGIALYRRADSETWWADVHARGVRSRCSTGTSEKEAARQFALKLATETKQATATGYTLEHALADWVNERERGPSDLSIIEILREKYPNRPIDGVDNMTVAAALKDLGPGNYNRYLAVIRAAVNLAQTRGYVAVAPKFKKRKEPPPIVRFLKKDEWTRLYGKLPDYLKPPVMFSLYTGLRKANVLKLQWSQIDLKRKLLWVEAGDFKSRQPHGIPLGADAIAILNGEKGKHDEWVFTYERGPMGNHKRAWATALKEAKVKDFRWHDLRHSWASWMAMEGAPLTAIKEAGGWASMDMVARYAHLSKAHLSGHINKVAGALKTGTKTGTRAKK